MAARFATIEKILSHLVIGGASCVLMLYFARLWPQWGFLNLVSAVLSLALVLGAFFLLLALFKLSQNRKTNLAITLVSLAFGVYLFEAIFWFSDPRQYGRNAIAAKEAGLPFDRRSRIEYIASLQREGIRAYPLIPAPIIRKWARNKKILPLGGISDSVIVGCNEGGAFMVFESDEHGFRNPRGLYSSVHPDVALVGDSFVLGSCVGKGADISSVIRAFGLKTINFGNEGNGPLTMLATIREYVAPLQPKAVIWLYYEENDLLEMELEKEVPLLVNYLNPGFTQHLIRRQSEIDACLTTLVNETRRAHEHAWFGNKNEIVGGLFWNAMELVQLRARLRLTLMDMRPYSLSRFEEFRAILGNARDLVNSRKGRLYFAYLPSWHSHANPTLHDFRRNEVLGLVHRLNIPVIDIHKVFSEQKDPLSLFPFRLYNHYDEHGYKVVATAIYQAIEHDLEEK